MDKSRKSLYWRIGLGLVAMLVALALFMGFVHYHDLAMPEHYYQNGNANPRVLVPGDRAKLFFDYRTCLQFQAKNPTVEAVPAVLVSGDTLPWTANYDIETTPIRDRVSAVSRRLWLEVDIPDNDLLVGSTLAVDVTAKIHCAYLPEYAPGRPSGFLTHSFDVSERVTVLISGPKDPRYDNIAEWMQVGALFSAFAGLFVWARPWKE